MSFEVTTPVFDGPFDLLLHLIIRDEVDLYEVTLATIVDAYIAELEKMELLNLDVATEFLLIAATLVELKSRRLLPDEENGDLDDELALWEERDLLLARLLECKTFKDASHTLEAMAHEAALSWPRTAGLEEEFIGLMPDLLEGVDPKRLRDACVKALTPRPVPRVSLDHVGPIRLSVTDACEDALVTLRERRKMTFRALTGPLVDRIEVVIYFLAVLELYKQGRVDIQQFETFGDITIAWVDSDESEGDFSLDDIDSYEG